MTKKIVSAKGGRVVINRCVAARGYHVWLDCTLKLKSVGSVGERYSEELASIMDSLKHPGYYRLEEEMAGYRKYYLRLVPATKKTMMEYIKAFDCEVDGQVELESALELIQDDDLRSKAQDIFYDILAEAAEKSCGDSTM